MTTRLAAPVDLESHARYAGPDPASRASRMASGLVGSEILRIAADVRALARAGRKVLDLTVGDFDPRQFPIPERLRQATVAALQRGETNYPPSNGVLELREAVQRFYARELALAYPLESVLVTGGARPVLYGAYRAVLDPLDRVVYPVPSWNNNHYVHLAGAVGVPVACSAKNRFLPRREDLAGALAGARIVCINSPLNPSGTAIEEGALRDICAAVLEENHARERVGERPLYLVYDHIYWMLCADETRHVTPPELEPELARWTIFVDGISKAFAATGLRVGWAVGPVDVIGRMSAILGHVGAWAPRAEQIATVALLDDPEALREFHGAFKPALRARLERLHQGLQDLRRRGQPLETLPPMGSIYLTARIHPFGRRTPDGKALATSEDVRRWLLDEAAFAAVPFQAFGVASDEGWFRLSVGAVSEEAIAAGLARLAQAFDRLR